MGAEGAFAPAGLSNEEPWQLILQAIKKAGYRAGVDVGLAADLAASEIFKNGKYELRREGKKMTSEQLIEYLAEWLKKYPIISIEDPLAETDWGGWTLAFKQLRKKVRIIADDLTATNKILLEKMLDLRAAAGIIIKPNQIGTLSETAETIILAQKNKIATIVSHRGGGETNDTFIVDLAVAFGCEFLKVGITRGERVAKYNRLLEIERGL